MGAQVGSMKSESRPARVPPFQGFLDAHRATVYRFLMVAVGPQDADDVFQETFLAALRAYPDLRMVPGWTAGS